MSYKIEDLKAAVKLQNAMIDLPEELRNQNWSELLRWLDQEIYCMHCDLDIPQPLSEDGRAYLPKEILTTTDQYCISARSRMSGETDSITGPMTWVEAKAFEPTRSDKFYWKYFRVSKYPFKKHKKR